MEEQSESTRLWCHLCERVVDPVMEIKSIKCSLCQDEFVRIMESVMSDHHHGQSEVALHGDSTYMTQLHVFGKDSRDEFHQSDSWQSKTIGFEPRGEVLAQQQQELLDKIKAVLKRLNFREERVLVQFCAPCTVGKQLLLTTVNKPYGLGDEELLLYRKESEGNIFVMDKDRVEGNSPPARLFRRGLPEWTPDLTNFNPKDFQQQDCAVRCNLHGYLALPVFNSTTRSSVGVLELFASSKYTSFAYEVQHIQEALKTENLISPQVFDALALDVFSKRMRELHKLHSFLKDVCEIYNLTLAQTWAVSQPSSIVPHDDVLQKSCSSFDTRCFGKVCMSTSGLPYHVQDLGMWTFREASIKQHLEKSRGVVGRASSSRGLCFCGDVTKLSETEYPLIHNARMSGLATCFAISIHSAESNGDYVLEFFLPCIKDGKYIMNLVQSLKRKIEAASGFELGDTSFVQEVGPHMDADMEPDTISTSSNWMADNFTFQMDSSDSESMVSMVKAHYDATDMANVSTMKMNGLIDVGIKNHPLTQGRKCKKDSLTMKSFEQHIGKPIGQAAESLGVSRSTLKRFRREHGISSWPVPKRSKKTSCVTDPEMSRASCSEKHVQMSSSPCFAIRHKNIGIYQITLLIVGLRRWRNKSSHRLPIGDPALCMSTGKPENTTNIVNIHSNVEQQLSDSSLVHGSSKRSVSNFCDMGMLMVKVTFNNDMIKFRFPVSSGLLELENEVARRVNVKGKRLSIRYKDEENDLVSITWDADLHALLASNSTIRLHAQLADDQS